MMIYLSKTQTYLVLKALAQYQRSIQESLKEKPETKELIGEDLFQLELLVTWFDRQREINS